MISLGQSQDALNDHFFEMLALLVSQAEFVGNGQEDQVGGSQAVEGGHEGHCHPGAQFGRLGKMLHHLDEAQHRPQDADGGSIPPGGFKDPGGS